MRSRSEDPEPPPPDDGSTGGDTTTERAAPGGSASAPATLNGIVRRARRMARRSSACRNALRAPGRFSRAGASKRTAYGTGRAGSSIAAVVEDTISARGS